MLCVCATLLAATALSPQHPSEKALATTTHDWPQFRGPAADSTLESLTHPRAWAPDRNVAWQVEVPGGGWSSPIVLGDRVFLTTAVSEEAAGGAPKGFQDGVRAPATRGRGAAPPESPLTYEVRCYGLADGALVWTTAIGKNVPAHGVHPSNTFATESPTTDGSRLFVTFGALGQVAAVDLEGEVLWRTETGVYSTSNDFGWGSSLATSGGLVFVQNDNEERSFVLALDAASGEERWHIDRGTGTCWSSPALWRRDTGEELVTCGPGYVAAYEPASGELLWKLDGLGGSFTASPTCDGDRVYFGNSGPGRAGPLVAVKAGARGEQELTRSEDPEMVAWHTDRAGPGFPSPVVAGDFVYAIGSMGVLACYDKTTGDRAYRKRLPGSATVVATPWTDGKQLFILDEEGKTFVVTVGPEFELTHTNEMPGLYWSTPSVAGDSLLLRAADRLICIKSTTTKY